MRGCASGSAAIGDGDLGPADGVLDATTITTTTCIRWWIVGFGIAVIALICEVSGLVRDEGLR